MVLKAEAKQSAVRAGLSDLDSEEVMLTIRAVHGNYDKEDLEQNSICQH